MDKGHILLPALDEGFKVNFLRRLYLDSLNLMLNPGFEDLGDGDPDFWAVWTETPGNGVIANETTIVHEGSNAAKLTAGVSANTFIVNAFSVTPGKLYRLRFQTAGDGINDGQYQIQGNINPWPSIIGKTDTGITAVTYGIIRQEFTPPAGQTVVAIRLWCPTENNGSAYYDTCDTYLLN